MSETIDGFSITRLPADGFVFTRTAEPHHKYEHRITSDGIELVRVVSAGAIYRDPQHYLGEVAEAADKYRRHLFPEVGTADAAE